MQIKFKLPIEWSVSPSVSSIQSYIYNIKQHLCLLWTSEGQFKTRYNNYIESFRHRECMNETELSKHVWGLEEHDFDSNLSWKAHKEASPYHCTSKCFKTLRDMFVRKSFHYLPWFINSIKQKNWTNFQVYPTSFIKARNKTWLVAGRYVPFTLLSSLDYIHEIFIWQLFCK